MSDASPHAKYLPPKVCTWKPGNGGKFAGSDRDAGGAVGAGPRRRRVNRTWGEAGEQMPERHAAADFGSR